jgi:putative membrane protein
VLTVKDFKNRIMKNYCKILLPVFLLIGLQSCGNADRNHGGQSANKVTDSLSDTTQRTQGRTADVDLDGDAKVFTLGAATGGMMEVEAAGVALKKSKNEAVKEFAARMLKDHGAANEELERIAKDKDVQLPQTLPSEMEGHIAKLNSLAERAFDVQYMIMMIKDHQKAEQLFTKGSGLNDPELKVFAVKTLPIIQRHYQSALKIGKDLNIRNANSGDDVLGISPSKVEKK